MSAAGACVECPEQRVVDWADMHEMESALALRADGRRTTISNDRGLLAFT